MPLCLGYSSTPCPMKANISVGRKRCRHCNRLSFIDYSPEEGMKWCPGNCGSIIRSTKVCCKSCSSFTFSTESSNQFMCCIGEYAGKPCSQSAYVLKKTQRCKVCRESIEKSTFVDFLQNGKHCRCNGCSGCDWKHWWSWIGESSKPLVVYTNCSRPIAAKKKAKTTMMKVCVLFAH